VERHHCRGSDAGRAQRQGHAQLAAVEIQDARRVHGESPVQQRLADPVTIATGDDTAGKESVRDVDHHASVVGGQVGGVRGHGGPGFVADEHDADERLLRLEVAAASATYTRVATANGVAKALLPNSTRESPTLYPPPSVFERGEWPQALTPEAQRLRDRIWTEIKSS